MAGKPPVFQSFMCREGRRSTWASDAPLVVGLYAAQCLRIHMYIYIYICIPSKTL